ncbi:L-type lectin-domain containing receptor kinase IX.1-like [Cannabis sativa]|uniref:L-type lectin-domain containing receptor kinase IX.1-like n=1 Tax=Cannabis sativa TaxID=3483 RepID=UPI0029CA7645|nr:L-type lectin-domain containing receptor kinase IX.1-like [Cannabis sativa]
MDSYYIFLSLLLLLISSANSLHFKISPSDQNSQDTIIALQGDALRISSSSSLTPTSGIVEMINKFTFLCRVGWATYPASVPLWDSTTGKLADFTTSFSFTIDTGNMSTYGHGLTFFLAPAGYQIPPNSAGGFLGLFNTTTADGIGGDHHHHQYSTSGSNQLVHVEFDSFSNPEWDPPTEHVGINVNSIASSVYTPWNASLHSTDNVLVSISYDSKAKNLKVDWSYEKSSVYKESVTSLSYKIDLSKVLPQWVTMGFSAATGLYGARHRLNSWEFNFTLDI